MDEATRFRKQAEQARQRAVKATSPFEKETWLRIAEDWTMLAENAPENYKKRGTQSPENSN